MKILIIALSFLAITTLAYSEVYIVIDKESGDVKGMVDIKPDAIGSWANNYVMKQADETYRGLKGKEIKYINQKLRKATEKEISDYDKSMIESMKGAAKAQALEVLGITEADIIKIKAL